MWCMLHIATTILTFFFFNQFFESAFSGESTWIGEADVSSLPLTITGGSTDICMVCNQLLARLPCITIRQTPALAAGPLPYYIYAQS